MKKIIFYILIFIGSTAYSFTEIGFWSISDTKHYSYLGKERKLSEIEKLIPKLKDAMGDDFTVYIYLVKNEIKLESYEALLKLLQKHKLNDIMIRSWNDKELKKEEKQNFTSIKVLLKKITKSKKTQQTPGEE